MNNIKLNEIVENQEIKMRSLMCQNADELKLTPKDPTIISAHDEVLLKGKEDDYDIRMLELDAKLYERGIKFPEKVEYINIEHILHYAKSLNPYPYLSGEDLQELHESLKKYGQIFPLLVVKTSETHYNLLDGNSRFELMKFMHLESNKEIYKTVKCFVLDRDSLNKIEIMDIILSCNISRKCDNETMTRVYMMRIEVEKARKTRKNEINVYRKVAKDMGVSVSTVHNYRTLSNCSEKTMFLLDNGYIHRSSARKLAGFTKEMQDKIIDEFGVENVRDEYLKYIHPEINERSIKPMVKVIKEWKYPPLVVLKISGMRNDILSLKEDIEKLLESRKPSIKAKMQLLKTKFNFRCGYECLETVCRKEPHCYKEVLKQENHPQMDIIKKSRRRE